MEIITETATGSIVLLLGMACAVWFVVRFLLGHLKTRFKINVFVIGWAVAALGLLWFVDVNVPLQTSHFRPGGEPAPAWLALLAYVSRLGFVAALILAGRQSKLD